jgi:polar amino acid transport system substrate-binding protein
MRFPITPARGAFALVLGAVLLGTTACGAQSIGETGSAAELEEPTLISAPAEDLAAGVIEGIEPDAAITVPTALRSEGLKVTTSVGYPPMEMWGADGKVIVGVDASLARGLARTLGVDLTITDQEFNAQIPGVLTGRFDMVMSSMTDNAERRETMSFVDYVRAGNAFLVQSGNPSRVKVPADLCGQIVSVVDNGSSADLAEEFSAQCVTDGDSAIDILKFEGDSEAILAVKSGRAAATIGDYPVAVHRAAETDSGLEAIAIDGGESPWGIAIDKKNTELVDTVQQALQSMIDSGSYQDILGAWGVEQMAVDSAVVNDGQ